MKVKIEISGDDISKLHSKTEIYGSCVEILPALVGPINTIISGYAADEVVYDLMKSAFIYALQQNTYKKTEDNNNVQR